MCVCIPDNYDHIKYLNFNRWYVAIVIFLLELIRHNFYKKISVWHLADKRSGHLSKAGSESSFSKCMSIAIFFLVAGTPFKNTKHLLMAIGKFSLQPKGCSKYLMRRYYQKKLITRHCYTMTIFLYLFLPWQKNKLTTSKWLEPLKFCSRITSDYEESLRLFNVSNQDNLLLPP